jgi:hypothetical protein
MSLSGLTTAQSDIPLCDFLAANATARSQFQNTFRITGGAGEVDVDFGAALLGLVEVITDECGLSAEAELIFALHLDGVPLFLEQRLVSIGPEDSASDGVNTILASTQTLEYDRSYELLIELDSETRVTTQPVPETLGFLSAGAALMVLMACGTRAARGRANGAPAPTDRPASDKP